MKQIDGLSADEINLRVRMLQSDIHVMTRGRLPRPESESSAREGGRQVWQASRQYTEDDKS